jgi:hypothetical protein
MAKKSIPPNPLRVLFDDETTTPEKLAPKIESKGGHASAKYLEHIAHGLMEPGWGLCFIVQDLHGIDARSLKQWPGYKRAKRTKHAA